MKKLNNIFLLMVCVLVLSTSCNHSKKKEKQSEYQDKLIGLDIIISKSLNLDLGDNYKILVYFDGDCSQCISEVLTLRKKINDFAKKKAHVIFLSHSRNKDLVEYYFDKSGLISNSSFTLKNDSENILLKDNSFLNGYKNVLLLNDNNIILSSQDPFKSEISMKIYKQNDVLN